MPFTAIPSPYLASFDGSFQYDQCLTTAKQVAKKKKLKSKLKKEINKLSE